ncbi:MAG: hypothetical protein ABII72_04915 [Parcubacteria group bacterium]
MDRCMKWVSKSKATTFYPLLIIWGFIYGCMMDFGNHYVRGNEHSWWMVLGWGIFAFALFTIARTSLKRIGC